MNCILESVIKYCNEEDDYSEPCDIETELEKMNNSLDDMDDFDED